MKKAKVTRDGAGQAAGTQLVIGNQVNSELLVSPPALTEAIQATTNLQLTRDELVDYAISLLDDQIREHLKQAKEAHSKAEEVLKTANKAVSEQLDKLTEDMQQRFQGWAAGWSPDFTTPKKKMFTLDRCIVENALYTDLKGAWLKNLPPGTPKDLFGVFVVTCIFSVSGCKDALDGATLLASLAGGKSSDVVVPPNLVCGGCEPVEFRLSNVGPFFSAKLETLVRARWSASNEVVAAQALVNHWQGELSQLNGRYRSKLKASVTVSALRAQTGGDQWADRMSALATGLLQQPDARK